MWSDPLTTVPRIDAVGLAQRMTDFAAELVDPMVCRTPEHGVPGRAHCAACCGGTGLVVTCDADQAIATAAAALNHAASLLLPLATEVP